MRYILLIYGNDQDSAAMSNAEREAELAAYGAFSEEASKRGAMLGGEALLPASTATTVRVRAGKVLTTDGPFAETKEQLGGYYVLQCKDLDEAIELAAKIPGAPKGSIEIRPLVEWN
ncbi:MAG: YciI family protein [Ktedonobacteraceae bacterium]